MIDETIIRCCAPTLAGIKTGSLFTCEKIDDIYDEVRCINQKIVPKGLRLIPIHCVNGRWLLYMYRHERLERDLEDADALEMLLGCGYPCDKCIKASQCISYLMKRIRSGDGAFPHEVGLFLSYPPADVKGFIENNAKGYKWKGLWKVYGDVSSAQSIYSKYKKCTKIYESCYRDGRGLEQLAVCS